MIRTIAAAAAALIGLSFAALARAQNEPAATQSAQPVQASADEEIVIRGRRTLFALRKEVETAREHVWQVFNDLNNDDDFDISCNDSSRTGTRLRKRTCRPEYANDATRRAGRDLARRLQGCQAGNDGCIEQAMQAGTADAQEQMAIIAYMDGRLDDEFRRLVREHPELMMAVYEFLRKEDEYKEAAAARQD